MTKLAIGIDLHRCIGCNTCALACKMQNNVPDGMLDVYKRQIVAWAAVLSPLPHVALRGSQQIG